MESFSFTPVGFIRSAERFRSEAPRQGVFSASTAFLELLPPYRGVAVEDLQGFDRIWLIFVFHLNLGKPWKPKVRPPLVPQERRYSLFATRSPHRVNPVGLSCVKLTAIRAEGLELAGVDLLDGTPVLDIKPYIPEADAFPDAAAGWRDNVPRIETLQWQLKIAPRFAQQAAKLTALGGPDLVNAAQVQLSVNPLDFERKRLYTLDNGGCELGFRTWRIRFAVTEASRTVEVLSLRSSYTPDELVPGAPDRYGDKELHRQYLKYFPECSVPRAVK